MDNQIVKNRILSLKVAMLSFPILSAFFIGFGIWLLTLLGNPNANPDAKTPVIATAIVAFALAIFFLLLWIFVIPKIIKKAEARLIEHEKMKEVYLKHKDD